MSYIQSILEPGEQVRYHTTLSWTIYTPDHCTISRARLIDLDTHREVFSWVLGSWPIADC